MVSRTPLVSNISATGISVSNTNTNLRFFPHIVEFGTVPILPLMFLYEVFLNFGILDVVTQTTRGTFP